ncbi:MAG: IMP dehydrogenase [Desulfohalobiaceae bacterium]|nr:IMP dehydrogenase [Desulfohalobiaceae bacterium]MCF8085373.1 IMP dehydrogenase [Desulfohalobiaceae bacterium]
MDKVQKFALTFDDVLLLPDYTEVLPHEVDVSTKLTPEISLNIPLLSAAMDTVTEAEMAIAIARQGGLGIVHKNMSVQAQSREVEKVKKSESGMIVDPVSIEPDCTVGKALEIMAHYKISGLPVVQEGVVAGIVTNRDVMFVRDMQTRVAEIMTTENLVTVSPGTDLEQAKSVLHHNRIEKLLVVDGERRLQGLITIKDIEKIKKYPDACKDELGRLRVGAAVGVGEDMEERVKSLVHFGVDALVLDSAHGYSRNVIRAVEFIKHHFPQCQVIAGNVATYDGSRALLQAGADSIKVGIGPGSICTTRVVSGVGVPQVTAIMECIQAAREMDRCLIADGGVKFSGDLVKALAAGADSVMMGSMLAGTEESPGETILYQGRRYKIYRGMGSIDAMREGSRDRYGQEEMEKYVPEGIVGRIPYKGKVRETLYQLVGGLRSGMGYVGSADIAELQSKSRFIQISQAGYRESHVHDVLISKEAPNYQVDMS